jgi:hypothetical protein
MMTGESHMGDVLGGTYIHWLSTRVIVLGEQQMEKQLSFLLLFGYPELAQNASSGFIFIITD